MKLKLNNDCNHGNSRIKKKEKKPGMCNLVQLYLRYNLRCILFGF